MIKIIFRPCNNFTTSSIISYDNKILVCIPGNVNSLLILFIADIFLNNNLKTYIQVEKKLLEQK